MKKFTFLFSMFLIVSFFTTFIYFYNFIYYKKITISKEIDFKQGKSIDYIINELELKNGKIIKLWFLLNLCGLRDCNITIKRYHIRK